MLPPVTPKKRRGAPSSVKSRGAVPIRLRDDADFESLRFQYAADDGHSETRVIYVGIPGDDDDVALLPAELLHFGT